MQFCKYALCYIILLANNLFAQERIINGSVRSTSNEPLLSASVNLVDERSAIIKFAITNGQGAYSLSIPSNIASPLWLEVSYIGYRKQRKAVMSNQSAYHFILAASPDSLSEVTIKKQPIISAMGDTLRYYVTSFANKEDRSIRDVLQRMPGIEVDGEGTIYYNGKKIENLYIQGDDLMDGRYGLATRSIRKEMILSVDVIRNHQPIRVLQDKVISDKTSINLILKYENNLKLSANAMAGAGLPKQYDASFTPMLLNRNIKMISTIAFNNSSVDYRGDLKQLGAANMLSNIGSDPAEISLSLATVGPPDLPLSSYYFNRSGIVNLNNIFTARNGMQLKANIQGFIDKNSMNYYSRVQNYLGTDTIAYNERQSFYNKPLLLNASFNMMMNRPKYFFNNSTRIKLGRETDNSFMDFNNYAFGQGAERIVNGFSNDLSWIPQLKGKGIGEVRWLISYSRNRQELNIGEGYYAEIKEHEGYHDNVVQRVNMPAFFSNGWFGYKITGEKILQEYKLGYIHESQTLGSALSFIDGMQETPYKGDAGNNLQWNRQVFYFSPEYQVKQNKFKSIIQLPLALQYIYSSKLIFNPYVYLRYDINHEQFLTARYRYSNTFGNITGVYRGAILLNYRALQANDAGLQEKRIHSSGIGYEFQKSINMLFVNMSVSHDRIIAKNILASEVADNIQKSVYLPYENTQLNTALNAGFSKYFFGLKSTISVKSQLSRAKYVQLINSELLPFYSDGLYISASLIKKIFGWANLTYQPTGWWMATKLQQTKSAELTHRMFRFDQRMSLGCNVKRFFIESTARHSYSKQSNNNDVQYFFMDATARYSNTKKSMDLSLSVTNLFNVKDYTVYSVSANRLVMDQYLLRGRMGVLRLSYYF